MICPRCADEHIEVMATSPVKGVWTVYQCQHCLYTWRDTEPLRRTSREHYPEAFRMTQKDIDEAPQVPTIPPLLKKKSPVALRLPGDNIVRPFARWRCAYRAYGFVGRVRRSRHPTKQTAEN